MAFRVQSRLGRSRVVDTFDAILEVQSEKLDVVIKRARPEFRTHGPVQEALLAWGQQQAEVDHPDIVAVLEAGQDNDGVYIIQEKVEGATLARLLETLRKGRRTLAPINAMTIAERVANAAAALPQTPAGFHGDLKPGEVLVGYDGAVKVGDQRLSDLAVVAKSQEILAEDDAYRGPEGYAPGPAADAYALALVVLEMMLGHPVWRTSLMTVDDALRALVDFAPVAQGYPDMAKEMSELLRQCLRPTPDERLVDLGVVADGISALMASNNIQRNPDGLGSFVELVSPPLEDADAPTRMAEVALMEAAAALGRGWSADRRAAFEAASVIITPEILAQAEAAYRQGRAGQGPAANPPREPSVGASSAPPPLPAPDGPRGPTSTLEGRSLSVAPVEPLPPLDTPAPAVPNVAERAAAAIIEIEWPPWLPYVAAGLVIVLMLVWWVSGSDPRTINLRLTSVPTAASVYVDDELVGQTPLTRPLDVDADQIELRFEKPGYEPYEITIGTEQEELRFEAPMKSQ